MSNYYKTLKIEDTGDLSIVNNSLNIINNDENELKQYIRTILSTKKEEFFLDTSFGLSHNYIIGKNYNIEQAKIDITEAILKDTRMATVNSVNITTDTINRIIIINFTATTKTEEEIELEVTI